MRYRDCKPGVTVVARAWGQVMPGKICEVLDNQGYTYPIRVLSHGQIRGPFKPIELEMVKP